ncbi:MAG: thiosulfate oxidation carrier protein SoxY [Magnetococcus sp. DMHC-6]
MTQNTQLTRRSFLTAMSATGAAYVATGFMVGLPRNLHAEEAAAAASVDDLVAQEMGAGAIALEKVKIDTPAKAENGALVRIPISVDHPMEANNYIEKIAIFVDNNPKPLVGSFTLSPATGKAEIELRIKMAKASKIRVIAKSNSGKLYGAIQDIQVAEGGCAG